MPALLRSTLQMATLIAASTLFTSCASIVSSSRYTVPIRSEPSGAAITIMDRDSAVVFQGHTPAMVELRSSRSYFKRGIYTVHLTAPDHEPFSQKLRANVSGWYWGNLLIGGAIGMLIVDPLTGAMYSLKGRYVLGQLHNTSALPAE